MSYYSEGPNYFELWEEEHDEDDISFQTSLSDKIWVDKNNNSHFFFEMDLSYLKAVKRFIEKENKTIPYELLREIYYKEKYFGELIRRKQLEN